MVGSAIMRRLDAEESSILPDPPKHELDLRCQPDVASWMAQHKPDIVIVAAARVGGIMDNSKHPADFIADNLQIETNIITAAANRNVEKLVFLGSSCIYPKLAPQPLREEYLLTGSLEETNRAYAIAKLAGIELVRSFRAQHGRDFISVLPCNLYGPNDTYDLERSHVIPALILKFEEAIRTGAPEIVIWGSGKPMREFMHVDDCADAIVHVSKIYSDETPINIGTGEDMTISDLVSMLCDITGYQGRIAYDTSKPDGPPRKLLDTKKLRDTGWSHRINLRKGLSMIWAQRLA